MKVKLRSLSLILSILLFLSAGWPNLSYPSSSIKWYGYDEGVELGLGAKKKILIYFHANWCYYCIVMEKETFQNPSVVAYLKANFISVKVDYDKEKEIVYAYGVLGLPTNWFINETGEKIGPIPGYIPPEEFLIMLKNI